MSELKVVKGLETSVIPTRGSRLAAGVDLSAAVGTTIGARSHGLVQTGLRIQVPEGTYGRVAPRSGLALKKGIDVGAGVIDADYRGLVGVVLFNHTDEDFEVGVKDRVAQLILEKCELAEVKVVLQLDDTDRGDGAYGSTGK